MTDTPEPVRREFKLEEGHVFRHVDDQLHSEDDVPAVVYADGTKWWYHEGKIHRAGKPAVIMANGTQEYWQNNARHRLDGPAVIYPATSAIVPELRGVKQWWTNGKMVREELPPNVKRYRAMTAQAHKACFGGGA